MERFLIWVGFVVVAGLGVLVAGGVWFGACTLILKSWHETWWIAAYACWKRRHGMAARRALKFAIEDEKKYKDQATVDVTEE